MRVRPYFWQHGFRLDKADSLPLDPVGLPRREQSPAENTLLVKAQALKTGADIVGIAKVERQWTYEDNPDVDYPWIIVMGISMDYETMQEQVEKRGRSKKAGAHVVDKYAEGSLPGCMSKPVYLCRLRATKPEFQSAGIFCLRAVAGDYLDTYGRLRTY